MNRYDYDAAMEARAEAAYDDDPPEAVDGGEAQDARNESREALAGALMDAWGVEDLRKWGEPLHPRTLKAITDFEEWVRADLLHEVSEAVKVAEDALGLMDAQAVGWRESGNLAQAASYESVARHMRSRLAALGLGEGETR